MSGRVAVPDLRTGDHAVDAFAESVRSNIERFTGQNNNAVGLVRLPAGASLAQIIEQLNLITDRLQGVTEP